MSSVEAGRGSLSVGQYNLPGKEVSDRAIAAARNLIADASTGVTAAADAEQAALSAAREAGDEVLQATNALLTNSGRSGYFPIAHQAGEWRLTIEGLPEGVEHQIFHTSRESALREYNRILQETGEELSASVLPKTWSFDGGNLNVSGAEFGKMVQAIRSAVEIEISAEDAAALLRGAGTAPTAGARKFSQFLQERRLGWRDFTEDPFRTLEFYLYNTERTLAFNEFERNASRLIGAIPGQKKNLQAWSKDYVNKILGRPTHLEEIVDQFIHNWAPKDIGPRPLRRYSRFLRRAVAASRLGGAFSGMVNATQIAVNTAPLIGAKWTAVGLRKILTPGGLQDLRRFFAENGVDLGLHMSLSREGELIGGEGVKSAIVSAYKRAGLGETSAAAKSGVEALERMWLFAFNGAERLNRTVTAWGAYQRGLSEGMDQTAALTFAREMVEKTQFNYRSSNIPTILQGPIGSLLGQFKTFFINEIELIASVDAKTRAKMLGAFSAIGGASAILELPGADIANHASEWLFDKKISETLALEAGEEGAANFTKLLAFGVPGLADADFSRYVGPGGLFELTRGWAGPTASDVASFGRFLGSATRDIHASGKISEDTYNTLFQRVIPSQIRRLSRAQNILESGEVRNAYSRKLLYRAEDRLRAAALTAIGPPSLRMTAERAADALISRQAGRYNAVRRSYGRQIGIAASRGRSVELSRLIRDANSRGIPFKPTDVRRWQRLMAQPISERRQRRVPLAIRADLEEFFSLE